jgi:hypothetical protein
MSGDILQEMGTDAAKWAEKFCEIFPESPAEGTMIGWFANAMCASEEERRVKDEQTQMRALGLLATTLAARLGVAGPGDVHGETWRDGAPEWFPQPPEWIDLWRKCVQIATADGEAPDYQELINALA